MGYVLSEKRFRVSRAEFERSISGASKDTQARYLRDYERYHREMAAKAVPRPVGASKAPSRVQVPSGGVKRSKPAAGASERYVLSEARFKESYDVFKARMKDLPKATQERYWRDWNRYHLKQSRLAAPKARNRFLHVFKVYAVDNAGRPIEYHDANGEPQPFYYKKYVDDKRRLDPADIEMVKLAFNDETNVNVSKVEVVMTCDAFITTRYH